MNLIKNIIKQIIMAVIILIALYRVTAQSQTLSDLEDSPLSQTCGDMIYKNFEFYQNETLNSFPIPESDSKDPEFIMHQNYPNPFNTITLIEFKLPSKCYVIIQVTDNNGNLIETLTDGDVDEGEHFVFYKPEDNFGSGDLKYRMNIYSDDGSKIVYTSEKTMTYKKANYSRR